MQVQPNAVTSALKSGRIVRRESDKKIHWPTQSKAWKAGRDVSKVRSDPDEDQSDGEGAGSAFLEAKTRKEIATAGLKELELETARGELVKASHVSGVITQFAIDVRDGIMTIPDRVASELAAELSKTLKLESSDYETIHEIVHRVWKRESRAVLEVIAHAGEFTKQL